MPKKKEFPIKISVFESLFPGRTTIWVDFKIEDMIDHYAYHDAPSMVNTYFTRDELVELRNRVDAAIAEFDRLEEEGKDE